jgi:hypothetical protein
MGCKTNQKENRGKCVELPFLWSVHLKNGMHLNHWISTHLDISHCSHCRYALGMGQTCGTQRNLNWRNYFLNNWVRDSKQISEISGTFWIWMSETRVNPQTGSNNNLYSGNQQIHIPFFRVLTYQCMCGKLRHPLANLPEVLGEASHYQKRATMGFLLEFGCVDMCRYTKIMGV